MRIEDFDYKRGLRRYLASNGVTYDNANGIITFNNEALALQLIPIYNPLPTTRADVKPALDAAAGKARARYITIAEGQEMTYNQKHVESLAFRNAGYPEADLSNYPFVSGEARRLKSTGQAGADFIIAMADQWRGLAAYIEDTRLDAKADIDAETNWELIQGIADKAVAVLESV